MEVVIILYLGTSDFSLSYVAWTMPSFNVHITIVKQTLLYAHVRLQFRVTASVIVHRHVHSHRGRVVQRSTPDQTEPCCLLSLFAFPWTISAAQLDSSRRPVPQVEPAQ